MWFNLTSAFEMLFKWFFLPHTSHEKICQYIKLDKMESITDKYQYLKSVLIINQN